MSELLALWLTVCDAVAMQPNNKTPSTTTTKPAGSSKTGAILAILALAFAAIGHVIADARFKSQTPVTNASERAGELVAQGATRGLATVLSMPMLLAGICLGILAIVLTVIKLRKVRGGGIVFSVVWIALSVWAIKIAAAGFDLIKAKS